MDNFRKLEEIFAKFPGIGPRQARRFVYYILSRPNATVSEFIRLLGEVRKQTSECSACHRLFIYGNSGQNQVSSDNNLCAICSDNNRDRTTLVVVARDSDFESIEKSGAYRGLYFILGGTIPILDKEPEKRVRLELLLHYTKNLQNLGEIILSLNTTPDGDNTAEIIKGALQKIIDPAKTKITILGRGLSTGAELEYADSETIKFALKNRN
jgi:recombination protein RecR